MTLAEAIELVYETVRTAGLSFAYGFKGETFTPPADEPWVRVSVIPLAPLGASHGSEGNRTVQGRGIIWCEARSPLADASGVPQDGVGRALAISQQVATLFQGKDIPATPGAEPINVQTHVPIDMGSDGAWYRYDARLSFTYQQTF